MGMSTDSLRSRNPHYNQEHLAGTSFPFLSQVIAKSLCLLPVPQWPLLPKGKFGFCGLQEMGGTWGINSPLGMKANRYTPGQQKHKKQPHFTLLLSHELAPPDVLVPWLLLEWLWTSEVKFASTLILSHRAQSATSNCIPWLDHSTLPYSYHTHFCPRDLGPKAVRNDH